MAARPSLRQLDYFVAVAEELHFGRAAERSLVSQPGLSAQVKELETRLEVQLFERGAGAVLLTAAGAALLPRARAILRDVDDFAVAAAQASDRLPSTLRIGAIPTMAPYVLPGITSHLRHLDDPPALELREEQTDHLVAHLLDGTLDLGILAPPVDDSLEVRTLTEDRFLLAVPEEHPLAGSRPLPLAVIAGLPMLLLEDGHCLREQALGVCALAGDTDATTVESASLSTLTQMVAAGSGVTLLPESAAAIEAHDGSGVVLQRFQQPEPSRDIALAWRRTTPYGEQFDVLVDELS